ncbi:Bug family tripartite tricarboxylate transporter substrate binding protein [Comamonas halotolerans]|uniref:Bug family tripartite tricarboxylate transporter substrate binding protein n=1 Tax=Comamonas halotolerans TaxID=3041496 RepID=UPI0039B72B0E
MESIDIGRRSVVMGTVAAGAGLWALPSISAQDFPKRPIRFVVPFNAGGSTDVMARGLAEAMSKPLGQPIIVENRTGASGMLGTDAVAKSAPDGYTVAVSLSTSLLINQFLYSKMSYKPLEDLIMLSQLVKAGTTLVVHPSVPANTMKELLAWVKSQKGKVAYGSWGVGSYAHLAGAYMSITQNADMNHIAYKGEAPMLQELIGGQLQLCFAGAQGTKPFIDAGRLKAIGVTGRDRMEVLPNLPTIYEQGVTDDVYELTGWVGMAVPAKTPKPVVDKLYAALQVAANQPKVASMLKATGFLPHFSSPEDFAQSYAAEMPVWRRLVEVAGARVD